MHTNDIMTDGVSCFVYFIRFFSLFPNNTTTKNPFYYETRNPSSCRLPSALRRRPTDPNQLIIQ